MRINLIKSRAKMGFHLIKYNVEISFNYIHPIKEFTNPLRLLFIGLSIFWWSFFSCPSPLSRRRSLRHKNISSFLLSLKLVNIFKVLLKLFILTLFNFFILPIPHIVDPFELLKILGEGVIKKSRGSGIKIRDIDPKMLRKFGDKTSKTKVVRNIITEQPKAIEIISPFQCIFHQPCNKEDRDH